MSSTGNQERTPDRAERVVFTESNRTMDEALEHTTARVAALPNVRKDSTYAASARLAGRLNAARVSEEELTAFHEERKALLDKKMDDTITRAEEHRLKYVRWTLDRIEDARHGYILDSLEESVARYEAALTEIISLRRELESLANRK